jgi:cyclic pyranopterin phosphate synthase
MEDNMNFTHFNNEGQAHMVDVSEKKDTKREAIATCQVILGEKLVQLIQKKDPMIKKGDVLSVAQVAGIMGAKKTWDLIPMCHNIPLSKVDIKYRFNHDSIEVTSFVSCHNKTGVEMEALTAVTVSALTIYDMCKSIDKGIEITAIKLLKKSGGKSGDYHANS